MHSLDWYEHQVHIPQGSDLESVLRQLPARWGVYLMSDQHHRPVQLLAVRNLRASVKRRLSCSVDQTGPGRRIDYRSVVHHIQYRRVDSSLECDLVYLQAARQAFADSYRQLLRLRSVWFVHIDPQSPFPRWVYREDPFVESGLIFGPIPEKTSAQRWVELIEDAFDLCRYYHILVQAPHGSACAYKDMQRCPAPCDGSVSMQQYRALVEWSVRTVTDPESEIIPQTSRMQEAASELKFEIAGRIHQFIEQLRALRSGEFGQLRLFSDFRYVTLQPGPHKNDVKLFVVTPAGAEGLMCLRDEPNDLMIQSDSLIDVTRSWDRSEITRRFDPQRLSIVVKHLFSRKSEGLFLHGDKLSDAELIRGYRQLVKKYRSRSNEESESDSPDEKVVSESDILSQFP